MHLLQVLAEVSELRGCTNVLSVGTSESKTLWVQKNCFHIVNLYEWSTISSCQWPLAACLRGGGGAIKFQ